MAVKVKTYEKRSEAIKQAQQAFALAVDILGPGNVDFSVDTENRRCTLVTPDMTGHNSIIHYVWEEDVQ